MRFIPTSVGNTVPICQRGNFHGAHKHLYGSESNLKAADDNFFNDKISSFVIASGSWRLYLEEFTLLGNYEKMQLCIVLWMPSKRGKGAVHDKRVNAFPHLLRCSEGRGTTGIGS